MRASGWKFLPGPESGGPVSMFHDDGASTARTGILVVSNASITLGNGSRTSPENEKPDLVSPSKRIRRGNAHTEDGINDEIGFFECRGKIVCERNI
jgi:hypothetical protein